MRLLRYLSLPAAALVALACADGPVAVQKEADGGFRPNFAVDLIFSDPSPSAVCPDGVDGWTKINSSSGGASGAWGSFSYSGNSLFYNINAGFVVEICIKSGAAVGQEIWRITGPEAAPPNDPITIAQGISHVSWRLVDEPTDELQDLSVSKGATATYTRTVSWTLTKTVDGVASVEFNGLLGDPPFGPVDWEVIATKSELESAYLVVGQITITNPNAFTVDVSVADALNDVPSTVATVDCDPLTAGNQATGTVPAEGNLICDYTASPADRSATLNRADVTVTGHAGPAGEVLGGFATAALSWTETLVGDDEVDLTDPRFLYDEEISSTTTENFPESFSCPTDPSLYTNGSFQATYTNTAFLDGPNTDLEASASVTLTCRNPWVGETATGPGYEWRLTQRAPNVWFWYTPYGAGPVDLIAGQIHPVGDITMSRNGTTTINIVLDADVRFANVANNVKIHPMDCTAAQKYVQPGKFDVKRTAVHNPGGGGSISVSGLDNEDCYGIHVDVERFVP